MVVTFCNCVAIGKEGVITGNGVSGWLRVSAGGGALCVVKNDVIIGDGLS